MMINLQTVTDDHKEWRNWCIIDNHIVWHDGSIKIHVNQLSGYHNLVNRNDTSLNELRRIYESPQHLTDTEWQEIRNMRLAIYKIKEELKNLDKAFDIIVSNISREVQSKRELALVASTN